MAEKGQHEVDPSIKLEIKEGNEKIISDVGKIIRDAIKGVKEFITVKFSHVEDTVDDLKTDVKNLQDNEKITNTRLSTLEGNSSGRDKMSSSVKATLGICIPIIIVLIGWIFFKT